MSQNNPYHIQIHTYPMGEDRVFLITGGKAHIGASAIAYWNQGKVVGYVHELPHHKEGELSLECAKLASHVLETTCSVLIGIHLDHATKEQIDEIVHYVRESMKKKVEELKEALG